MTLDALAGRLSPDVPQTFRRFPLPILLTGLATIVLIANLTELVADNQDLWGRIVIGLVTAAIFATGGALFAENNPKRVVLGIIAAYIVPLAALAALQVRDTTWIFPWLLPVIGSLWTSVSASTSGWRSGRTEAQDRYWWLNHLAITSGAIVGLAWLIVLIGTFAIGQTVSILFGLDLSTLIYKITLPAISGFFAPLYWLSTLPRASDYQPGRLEAPDFLVRAVAMIGKFILIPLLLAYAAILLVYAVQILITQQLPEGLIGWMVLGFVTTGAGAWLVLHPEYLRDSIIVRFFRRWWFWTTIVPLILYFTAVQVRIDAYGFTPERLLLIWGGVWATAVTALFLLRRGDIRLIAILAAVSLVLASVGPWNIVGLSRSQQSATFDNLLPLTDETGASYGITPTWTPEEASRARSAVDFLVQDEEGREAVRRILFYKGFELNKSGYFNTGDVMLLLGVRDIAIETGAGYTLLRDPNTPVDVSATPFYVGDASFFRQVDDIRVLDNGVTINKVTPKVQMLGLGFTITDTALQVYRAETLLTEIDLNPWFSAPDMATLSKPFIDFEVEGRSFRIVVDTLGLSLPPSSDGTGGVLNYLYGKMFAGPVPAATQPGTVPVTN